MRLYDGKIPVIVREATRALINAEALDVEPPNEQEFEKDIEAVLREYVRTERQINARAKDLAAAQGETNAFRFKRRLAKQRDFKLGEDSIEYIVDQLIETFLHSTFVEEVYAEDIEIRRILGPVLKRHMAAQEEVLDQEVRSKIKNIEEGSKTWDLEYERVMERLKRNKNME